ncbi:MAG TPA: hypothetical protein VHI78_12170, partial [Bacteroidales bacterium]|nr:hypothetical protein [Bacteroidales bacterium]
MRFFFLSLIAIASLANGQQLPEPFMVIPQPRQIVLKGGGGFDAGSLRSIVLKGLNERPVMGSILSELIIADKPGRGSV